MKKIDRLLQAVLYRLSCPEAETLGDYFPERLTPGQRLVVAQHLRECPHCTRELALFATADAEWEAGSMVTGAVGGLRGLIGRVLWASPVETLLPAPVVRGQPDIRRVYRAENIEVEIQIGPSTDGYRRQRMLGQIRPSEGVEVVALYDDVALLAAATPDEQGVFEFDRLRPGLHHLCLRAGSAETWLALTVGG